MDGMYGHLEEAGNSEVGESEADFGYILKEEQIESAQGLDFGCETKRGLRSEFKIFGLSRWKHELVAY